MWSRKSWYLYNTSIWRVDVKSWQLTIQKRLIYPRRTGNLHTWCPFHTIASHIELARTKLTRKWTILKYHTLATNMSIRSAEHHLLSTDVVPTDCRTSARISLSSDVSYHSTGGGIEYRFSKVAVHQGESIYRVLAWKLRGSPEVDSIHIVVIGQQR